MIKQLKKSDIAMSPFTTIKAWELFNISDADNDSLILSEDGGYEIASEFVNYQVDTNPDLNRTCDISLEQQNQDEAIYEEGISGSGVFDPSTDVQNCTGTYKCLLYTQIRRAFYNQYYNPFKIFGMENIDFPLNKTNRFLADNFRMFTIPRRMFGDKMSEGSIQFYDNTFDDNVEIYDDKLGNLIAGENLFSKVQEIRHLGNLIAPGTSSYDCPEYIDPS